MKCYLKEYKVLFYPKIRPQPLEQLTGNTYSIIVFLISNQYGFCFVLSATFLCLSKEVFYLNRIYLVKIKVNLKHLFRWVKSEILWLSKFRLKYWLYIIFKAILSTAAYCIFTELLLSLLDISHLDHESLWFSLLHRKDMKYLMTIYNHSGLFLDGKYGHCCFCERVQSCWPAYRITLKTSPNQIF